MNFLKITGIILSLGLFSCTKKDVPTGNLVIKFNAHYGNLPFAALNEYPYGIKQSIKFSKLDFFITHCTLKGTNAMSLDQNALIDLTGTDITRTFSFTGVRAGEYTGLEFILGVNADLNKKTPSQYKSTDALSSTSHYWDTWNSYIFSKIEGVLDTNGMNTYDLGIAIHTGTDDCARTVSIRKSFTISTSTTPTMTLDIDVEKIFKQNGVYFDLINSPLNHNPINIDVLKNFSTAEANAIILLN